MKKRCPHCGGLERVWTPERILNAIRAWTSVHGRAPSGGDWNSPGRGHPSVKTVRLHFPSFGEARCAAGVEYRRSNARHRTPSEWSRDEVLQAMYQWRFTHGRLPRGADWRVPEDDSYPSYYVVRTLFGTWNAGIVAAGYEPSKMRRPVDGYRKQAGNRARRLAEAA